MPRMSGVKPNPQVLRTCLHKEVSPPLPNDCLTDRAIALANATSKERHKIHQGSVRQITAAMNARGIFHSSMHVNEVSKACATELQNIARLLWEDLKRAHESCGQQTPEKLEALFLHLLQTEKMKMEAVVEGAVGGVAKYRQNKSMIPMREVSEEHEALVDKYKIQIAIYISNLRLGVSATLTDRIRRNFLNHRAVAGATIVAISIVALAGFTEAIEKLIRVTNGLLGNG